MNQEDANRILSVWEHQRPEKNVNASLHLDLLDQIASLFSIGPYYYYIMDFKTMDIIHAHPGVEQVLGVSLEDFNIHRLFELMHPDDLTFMYEKERLASEFFNNHTVPEAFSKYKVMYLMRVRDQNGRYRTILHQTKALHLSKDGGIQTSITVHTDVTYLKMPITQQISFVSDTLPCYYAIESNRLCKVEGDLHQKLTSKEKGIVRMLSTGKTSKDISEDLSLSIHTVNTHKKNILNKSKSVNTAELMAKCLMEGII